VHACVRERVVATFPLFPLHAVLFPSGPLHLRIFEARYVDMVRRCLREDEPFGVALITSGSEVGRATTVAIGTTARIVDFDQLPDGLLGIRARGERRFRIHKVTTQNDGLNVADVELFDEGPRVPVPEELNSLVEILREIYPQARLLYDDAPAQFDDACWVSARLAELLPLELSERQTCLELDGGVERLRYLDELLRTYGARS
jgi:Lon protease-like protein